MERRIVHSLSTYPIKQGKCNVDSMYNLFSNLWYYALSHTYAKENGATTVLYTDTLGYLFLQYIPYDEVHVILDNLYTDINPRFWAYAKIMALTLEPIGSVHIDGDVFIKTETCMNEIFNTEYDVLVQQIEEGPFINNFHHHIKKVFFNIQDECEKLGFVLENNTDYNTGIFSFRNKELKKEYLDKYKYIAKLCSKVNEQILNEDKGLSPDCVLEQELIYDITKNKNVKILLGTEDVYKKAKDLGFQHVYGGVKFKYVDKVKNILKKHDVQLYNKLIKICQ